MVVLKMSWRLTSLVVGVGYFQIFWEGSSLQQAVYSISYYLCDYVNVFFE